MQILEDNHFVAVCGCGLKIAYSHQDKLQHGGIRCQQCGNIIHFNEDLMLVYNIVQIQENYKRLEYTEIL
jgi:Fe2+ or Zn2+ uptake regulation protein